MSPSSSAGSAEAREGAPQLEAAAPFRIYGVVHLLPLPGGPRPSPGLAAVLERALSDAAAIAEGGAAGLIVENFGDAPFPAGASGPHVVAGLARVAAEVRRVVPGLELGINVLRNDGAAALAVAGAVGAQFVRVNVLSGATWTDQGLIQGEAHALLQYRRSLGLDPREHAAREGAAGVEIYADVLVKHGVPAGEASPARVAEETRQRAGADALIVTGVGTGHATSPSRVRAVVAAAGGAPVWVGSGTTPETVGTLRAAGATGAIVGTFLHAGGQLERPLDVARVRAVCAAAR